VTVLYEDYERPMKELVVISGKGGTGKTSIVASFAALAEKKVMADCDVDAADLHLILRPKKVHSDTFTGRKQAIIDLEKCQGCGECIDLCRFDAITLNDDGRNTSKASIDQLVCEGCGVCVEFCPENAIELKEKISGEWYISRSRYGPMVHARLGIAEENSGKLVSLVRFHARNIAYEKKLSLVIIDGSPGIGCPVIASITGSSLVLAVTEPTLSGLHDLERVIVLTKHFNSPMVVCINKYDINPDISHRIEEYCLAQKLKVVGKLPYDTIVTKAQIAGVSVVEYSGKPIAFAIKKMWREINYLL